MTNKELLEENAFLKQKVHELEHSESERKHADVLLRESEERFRQLFDHIADGVAVYQGVDEGQDFVFVDINRMGQFLSKIRLDEAVGRRITEVFPSVERIGLLGVFRRVWRTGQPEHHPLTEYADDRIVQWVENYVFKLLSGLIVVIYSDTSDKHRAEEALRQSEENFRHSLDDSSMGVRIVTIEGKTIYANRAILDVYGYDSVEELRTTSIEKRYTPQSYAEFKIRREKRKRGVDGPSEYEISIVRENDEIRHLQVFRKDILWNGKRQSQVLYNDITERKRAEEALKESEERYRQLFENAPAGIYEIDLTTGRLLSVNDVICKYTGYTKDELLAISALDLLTGESQKIFIERMAGYAAGKPVPSTLEFKARTKSGREFWMTLNAKYFFNAGVPVRAAVVAYEVTERKRAEDELRDSKQQLRAFAGRLQKIREEERVMIAREIHDEMGGGLTGLKMDLSWLLQKIGDADPCEERVALMDKIHASNALIDQMIHVVRRISTDLRPSVLDDLGLIAALEWQLSEFTRRTEIQHEFIKTFDYVYLEEGTAVAVFRIFQEALTNVVRHSRATKVVVVLLEGERSFFGDESLVLEIRDNGRGITEEEILNKDSLGLLGMKERVLTFGGELSICGEPGGGTALILNIPRKRGEPS